MNMRLNEKAAEEYLFESLHQALMFAYRYNGQQYSPSLMAQMMRGSVAGGKGLGGLDGAAQAGIIRGWLEGNLTKHESHMIIASYARDEIERLQSMMYFTPAVIACLPTGMHSRRAADVLIQKWFGERLSLDKASQEIGAHRNTVGPMWATTRRVLEGIWQKSEESAHRQMQIAGLIP